MKRSTALRRATPLRQASPLRRSTPLRASAEAVAAFVERGRVSSARSLRESARRAARARAREAAREGPLTPEQWRRAAFIASGGVCMISGARARDADDRRFHVHHPLPKGELRARGLHGYVWDPRNALWVLGTVHLQHETPGVRDDHRIARRFLPASVWEFCRELDELAGNEWASALVERLHPVGPGGGDQPQMTSTAGGCA